MITCYLLMSFKFYIDCLLENTLLSPYSMLSVTVSALLLALLDILHLMYVLQWLVLNLQFLVGICTLHSFSLIVSVFLWNNPENHVKGHSFSFDVLFPQHYSIV